MSEKGTLRLLETPLIPTHHPLWTDPLWQMLQDFALTHHKHAEQPPQAVRLPNQWPPPVYLCIYSLLLFKFLLLLLNLSFFLPFNLCLFLFCLLFFFFKRRTTGCLPNFVVSALQYNGTKVFLNLQSRDSDSMFSELQPTSCWCVCVHRLQWNLLLPNVKLFCTLSCLNTAFLCVFVTAVVVAKKATNKSWAFP